MPTPIGHALGGLATGWFSRHCPSNTLLAACVGAAVAPDLDILIHHHRAYTHSVGAAIVAGVIAWAVARNWRVALTIAAAYGTHILLDWLGQDTAPPFGVLALWPFSSRYYISGADLFMGVSRRYWKPDEFIVGNLKVVGWEILLLAPIVVLAYALQKMRTTEDTE